MLYTVQQGPHAQKILEECFRDHRPIPEALRNAPELTDGLDIFYEAFFELMHSRSGMGDGPIPWSVISQYCDKNEIEGDERDEMHFFIRRMDAEFLEWNSEKGAKS